MRISAGISLRKIRQKMQSLLSIVLASLLLVVLGDRLTHHLDVALGELDERRLVTEREERRLVGGTARDLHPVSAFEQRLDLVTREAAVDLLAEDLGHLGHLVVTMEAREQLEARCVLELFFRHASSIIFFRGATSSGSVSIATVMQSRP